MRTLQMISHPSLVSIIVPVRNGLPHLQACIESVVHQTWTSLEVIVVDDGSTDGSAAYIEGFGLANVRVIGGSGSGACAARNTGFKSSTGDFIQFLDADDLLAPDKIERQMSRLLTADDPHQSVSYSSLVQFRDGTPCGAGETWHTDNRSKLKPLDLLSEILSTGRFIQTGQWLTPRALIEAAGLWDESLIADQDGDYFSRVLSGASVVLACPDAVAFYRRSNTGKQISAGKSAAHFESRMRALEGKLSLLRGKVSIEQLQRIVQHQCGQLAFGSFPANPEVTTRCLHLMDQHCVDFRPEFPTPQLRLIAKWFGWKAARYCSYFKHRGRG